MTKTVSTADKVETDEPCPHCGMSRSEAVQIADYEREMKQLRLEKAAGDAASLCDASAWWDAMGMLYEHCRYTIGVEIRVSKKLHDALVAQFERQNRHLACNGNDPVYETKELNFRGIPIRCKDGQ